MSLFINNDFSQRKCSDFHTYVGSGHFLGVKNFEFQYFWGFQKNEYFFGYEDFVDIFLGLPQNWTIFRGHFYAF